MSGYRRVGIFAFLSGVLKRVAQTAVFQYIGEGASGLFGAIARLATTGSFTYEAIDARELSGADTPSYQYLPVTPQTPLFGAIIRESTVGSYSFIGVDGTGSFGVVVGIGATGEFVFSGLDAAFTVGGITVTGETAELILVGVDGIPVFGGITGSSDTPSMAFVGVDGVPVVGAISGVADTGSISYVGVDGDPVVGAITATATTPSITLSANDATGDVGGGAGPFDDWSNYFSITTDNSVIDSDITNPVILIDLRQAPASFWTAVQSATGDDVVIGSSDGATRYPTYMIYFDNTAEQGLVAARVPDLTAASADTYRLYVNNSGFTAPAVDAAFGRDEVFQDYEAVWDFMNLGGSAPEITDLTGNGHDGTLDATGTPLAETDTEWFGRGIRLTRATDDTTNIKPALASSGLDGDGSSLRSLSHFQVLKSSSGNANDMWGTAGTNRLRQNSGSASFRFGATDYPGGTMVQDALEHHATVFDGVSDTLDLYKNGSNVNAQTGLSSKSWPSGTWVLMNAADSVSFAFDGTFHLFFWKNGVRSAAEIKAEYSMGNDNASTFWTWGTIQTP